MADYLMNLNIPCYRISEDEFTKLDQHVFSCSRILLIFSADCYRLVLRKIVELNLDKDSSTLTDIIQSGMFYIDDTGVRTIGSNRDLFSLLYDLDKIKKIYILGEID